MSHYKNPPQFNPVYQNQNDIPNRADETRFEEGDLAPINITLTQIDTIIQDYFENILQPTIENNEEIVKVPVIFSTPERWASIKKYGVYRDEKNDKLQPPMIFLRRSGVTPAPYDNPNNKYVYYTQVTRWDKRNVYDRFAVVNGVKPTKEIREVIVPDQVMIDYEIIMWTPLFEQLNTLIEQVNVENHEYWGRRGNYKFRVSIDNFADSSELPATEDRVARTAFRMRVAAYIVPERIVKNFNLSNPNRRRYSVKKIVTTFETEKSGSLLADGHYI